jgi:hypothetical protein
MQGLALMQSAMLVRIRRISTKMLRRKRNMLTSAGQATALTAGVANKEEQSGVEVPE